MKFDPEVLYFFVYNDLVKGNTHPDLVKWTNTMYYVNMSYENALLKSYAYYLEGSDGDARDALKSAKKMRPKGQEITALEKELKKVL